MIHAKGIYYLLSQEIKLPTTFNESSSCRLSKTLSDMNLGKMGRPRSDLRGPIEYQQHEVKT